MKPLGDPMIGILNEAYETVLNISELYFGSKTEKSKARLASCVHVLDLLADLEKHLYVYWILSARKNQIKRVDERQRQFCVELINREKALIVGVAKRIDPKSALDANMMTMYWKHDTNGVLFLEKLQRLVEIFYPRCIRLKRSWRDEEVVLASRFIRDAFYCAYRGNKYPENKKQYEYRKKMFSQAISDMYKMDRPLTKLFMAGLFSNEEMQEISDTVLDVTKILCELQNTDKKRFSDLE